ncbi:hypothetical protein NH340_JMT06197 [Sarcoptes scabiei]|nr:hypothetical protein NH340_JMT06197 [Sarcoptes scabiei]
MLAVLIVWNNNNHHSVMEFLDFFPCKSHLNQFLVVFGRKLSTRSDWNKTGAITFCYCLGLDHQSVRTSLSPSHRDFSIKTNRSSIESSSFFIASINIIRYDSIWNR